MDKLFLTVLNMSLTGAYVVAAICLARLLLVKTPKIVSYCLWAVAGFRLAFPVSIESMFSLIPFNAQTIPLNIASQPVPAIDSGMPFVNNAVGGVLRQQTAHMNLLREWAAIGSWVWLVGAVVMIVLGMVSYILLKQKLNQAIRVEGGIYETDVIQSPFVLGILKPQIYIPLGLSGGEREYIINHERAHIRRHDHIIKFAAYFILCMHWFNPLVWAAFTLMGVDMEMSCDERVLKNMGGRIKKDYSMSLLSLATCRRIVNVSPLAFGEDGVEKRIKNVLKYKKPSRIVVVSSVALAITLSIGLIASRAVPGDLENLSGGAGSGDLAVPGSAVGAGNGAGHGDLANLGNVVGSGSAVGADNGADIGSAARADNGTGSGSAVRAEAGFTIMDYYNEGGGFSALGLSLEESNSERVLAVGRGDTIIVGGQRYEVSAESLTLSFYTQPSLDQVVSWWADYLNSWAENGKVTATS